MWEQIALTHIIQWVVIVFAAGFIGFFGKHLGQMVMMRMQGKKSVPPLPASGAAVESPSSRPSEDAQKASKKLAKQELKQMKKGSAKPS